MRNFKQLIITVSLLLSVTFAANAGQDVAKTMPLGDGITESGIVRLVVKLTDDAVGPDIGITLHEGDVAAPWNDAMAILMFDFVKNTNGGIHLAGYNGAASWDWEASVKAVEKGKQIALWITVDPVNNTHSLSAQMEGETEVTSVYADYGDRASLNSQPNANAKFCSVFVNNRDGQLTSAIEVIKDAEVVTAIEAYTFETSAGLSAAEATADVTVQPTVAEDEITLSSDKAIASVVVLSISGQEMISVANTTTVDVSGLANGIYLVKATTVDGGVAVQQIVKK